jgi:FAD:protein FMN transferase
MLLRTLGLARRLIHGSVVATILLTSACRPAAPDGSPVSLGGPTMGARWSVTIAQAEISVEEHERLQRLTQAALTGIERLLSTWDPASELSRFNAMASTDIFPVAPETFEAFRLAASLSAETGGAFDPTVAPLIDAWGFGSKRDVPVPDDRTVERLRADVGMALVELDSAGAWVRKRKPGVRCNFSAFVPGWAADRIAADLVLRGYTNFLVDVGGEIVARGLNQERQPWQVAIERPEREDRIVERVVSLTNRALSTSGDYRNFREVAGRRLPHILDPRTGRPVDHTLASASVITDTAARADAMSTAMMVLGPDSAMAFARERKIGVLLLVRTAGGFEERQSPEFAQAAP